MKAGFANIMKILKRSHRFLLKFLVVIFAVASIKLFLESSPEIKIETVRDSSVEVSRQSNFSFEIKREENASCRFELPPASSWYDWKDVNHRSQIYLFSAFLGWRDGKHSVLIIGISESKDNEYMCRIWSADLRTQIVVKAEGTMHSDIHNRRYDSWSYECEFNAEEISQPGFVSIVEEECQAPSHFLVLQNALHPSARNDVPMKTSDDNLAKVNFTICLSPLNLNYDAHQQLIEWIEVNRMFGAQRFFVYNHSSTPAIGKVLKHYHDEGILHVIPWKIPVRVFGENGGEEEVHYFGQKTALNDCFHRAKTYSRFIINVDVDEIIVPRNGSYAEMLQRTFDSSDSSKPVDDDNDPLESCVFLARNTFFRIDKSRDFFAKSQTDPVINSLKEDILRYDAKTLWMTTREMKVYSPGQRSKIIVGSNSDPWLEIHYAIVPCAMVIPENEGLLHHYRSYVMDEFERRTIKDSFMHKFAFEIISRLKDVYNKLRFNATSKV